MLSEEENRRLTQVGPGTPMGEVLRRHWHPVAGVDELARHPVKPLRLMGEDLVLYQDLSGDYGLVDRHCAHRRADLSHGYVEQHGLRCSYHGWCYDARGRCTEQPYQDLVAPQAAMKDKVRLKSYRVQAHAGMLWAYLGPEPAPLLPDWEAFHWANGFVQVVFAEAPCNWLQAQENSIDPVHFEWMHANWGRRLQGRLDGRAPTHLKLAFEEFEHGLLYKRVTEGTDENHPLWTIGRVCLWPNGFFLGDHFEWRVPIDDEHMLSVTWAFLRVPNEAEPYVQREIPSWSAPVHDAQGRWINSHIINQDIIAWAGQGAVTDRSRENLALSDRGIVMLRRQLQADIDAVSQGRDPKGVMRDEAGNQRVHLPCESHDFFLRGLPLADYERHPKWARLLRHFLFHAGQPDAVKRACEAATGVKLIELDVVDV